MIPKNVTAQTIQWCPDALFTLDVAEFETVVTLIAAAQEAGDYAGAADSMAVAVALFTCELLPDFYDDWILPLRERLYQGYSDVLERLVLQNHGQVRIQGQAERSGVGWQGPGGTVVIVER